MSRSPKKRHKALILLDYLRASSIATATATVILTAVDGAIEKVDKTYSKKHQEEDAVYLILRLGTPAKCLPERVLLTKPIEILGKELYEQKAQLKNPPKKQKNIGHITVQKHVNDVSNFFICDFV